MILGVCVCMCVCVPNPSNTHGNFRTRCRFENSIAPTPENEFGPTQLRKFHVRQSASTNGNSIRRGDQTQMKISCVHAPNATEISICEIHGNSISRPSPAQATNTHKKHPDKQTQTPKLDFQDFDTQMLIRKL